MPADEALIGFADSLSAPEVAWSLAESGFRVRAFAKKGTKPALLKSRFVRVEYITDPGHSADEALSDLKRIATETMPVLMPLDDASLWLLGEVRKEAGVRSLGLAGHHVDMALDKRLQVQAAIAAGFLVPDTRLVESSADLNGLSFPFIVKPALAARVIGGRLGRGRAYVIGDDRELAHFGREWNRDEPMLAQPLLKGVGEGVFGFTTEQGVVCWSGHRRLRMVNPAGSGSSACISTTPEPPVLKAAESFVMSMGWRGLFMIELLRDINGRLWFMELNGRPWGSMALARRSGFEYPGWTARQAITKDFVPATPPKKAPIVCRHLGRELLHLIFVWRGPTSRAIQWPSRLRTLAEICGLRSNERWYNYNRNDQKVFWAETWQSLSDPLSGHLKALRVPRIFKRVWGRIQRPVIQYEQAKIRMRDGVSELLAGCRHILFVCYGNINRSALAEQTARQLSGLNVSVSSCGFHAVSGRPIDPTMQQVAGERGIQFPSWSSRRITSECVETADLIFAMEASHLVRLFAEYPQARGKSFLLSCVTKPNTIPLEIRDPYGHPPAAYRRCIDEVTYATKALYERIRTCRLQKLG